jgi:hypothetical protein
LIRASIKLHKSLAKKMDCRVKPGNDGNGLIGYRDEIGAIIRRQQLETNAGPCPTLVLPGLDPGIHHFLVPSRRRRGMAGSSPATTVTVVSEDALRAFARP